MGFEAKIQQKINAYRQTHPKVKMSDEQIVSILVKNGEIVLSEDQKRSLFANNSKQNNNTGLKLEKTAKKPNPEKTIYLQSGRKVVYSKLSNGKTVMKYYGADGNRINPDYFKKVEGQISISADGNSYTVTKNGKKQTLKAKNPVQGAIDQNIAKLNNQEKALNKAKKEQGWIGKGWDWLKNTTGFWAGSDKAQQQIDAERKLLKQVKTGKISKKDFKEVTGQDYTKENLAKFQKGELSQAETKINDYKEGQDMATDMVGDMVSGIAAVGIYTAALATAPVTGGASLWVGFGLATASGAAIKVGVKALDTVGTDKKYTLKDLKHDAATGAFSGALAPVTAGLGGAVGKTVATKFGVQAIKTVGKEVAEEAAKGGVKSTLKAALANPAGYEYVGGTLVKRGTAMAAEMATDGALGGAIDGGFRAGLDNDWDANAILSGTIEGGIGGAVMAPVIGGGMKGVGIAFNRIKGVDEFSSLVSNCDKLADDDLKELYKYYKTLEIESNYKGKEIPDIKKSSFEKLMQEIETRKINVDDIEIKNRYLLEGDVSPDDLSEVAPFAQHLTEEKHIGDIVVPNKENVEIVNGDFVNGEFVPDIKSNTNLIERKKEGIWGHESLYYKGQPVATTKPQLIKQIRAKEQINTKKLPWQIEDFLDELKTKEDIQKASMLISDLNEIGPSNYKDFFINRGYMKMCESPEDIPILSMILNKHISYYPSASDSDVLKIIKEKLYLYEFFDKGPDIARENMQSYDYSHIGYTLFDIAQGIKTKEQIEAVFELIKAIKSGISYERNTIALTINKFVKTKKDIEPYTNFIKEFRNMRNLLSRSDNEECINTLYKIFTEEPRFTYREVTELLEQPNGNGTIEQINRLNSIIKLKDKGLSGKLVIDLCCSTLDDNGKFVQNRLDILLRENNPVDMILKILDEPGGRFTANLTLLKEVVTDYNGHVDKEAFAKLLELYQTKIPDVTHISNIYNHCDSTGGTVNSECIKAVEEIIDSGYPYDTINSILSNMVGVWNTLPKEEFVSILKNMIKANPKILEQPQDLCSKFNRFAKATNYGMMKQETEAAIKLMKNGICPDCDRLFDDESNFIRLFRKARKENGEIDNTKIDKAIELYKLSIPHYLVDQVIDYDITKIRQLYDLGFRDLNLFNMYDVSDKARDFILKNIPIDKLEYADIHIVNLAVDFLEYNSVLEMDKVTKQKFLNCIMRSNGYLLDAKNTKDCIKILPTTPEEYISTVQKLAKSLNIEIKNLEKVSVRHLEKIWTLYVMLLKKQACQILKKLN